MPKNIQILSDREVNLIMNHSGFTREEISRITEAGLEIRVTANPNDFDPSQRSFRQNPIDIEIGYTGVVRNSPFTGTAGSDFISIPNVFIKGLLKTQ